MGPGLSSGVVDTEEAWRKWKRIAADVPPMPGLDRTSCNGAVNAVYRLGQEGFRDCSSLQWAVDRAEKSVPVAVEQGSPSLSLQRELCSLVFRPGMLSAIPCLRVPAGGCVTGAVHADSVAGLSKLAGSEEARDWSLTLALWWEAGLPDDHDGLVFEPMQIQLQGKKFAPSRSTQCWRRMVMPLTLRTWAPAAGGGLARLLGGGCRRALGGCDGG